MFAERPAERAGRPGRNARGAPSSGPEAAGAPTRVALSWHGATALRQLRRRTELRAAGTSAKAVMRRLPATDPGVIVRVTDATERLCSAEKGVAPGRFSCWRFVDTGETLEEDSGPR